jgi:large subunit ribosomal protein L35
VDEVVESVNAAPQISTTRPLRREPRQFSSQRSRHPSTTMSSCQKAVKPLSRCLVQAQSSRIAVRAFTTSSRLDNAAVVEGDAAKVVSYNPMTVTAPRGERKLMRAGILPIGSRRRRAAIKTSDNLPFEQLPYQCFQEARKVLQADRATKLKQIESERAKIARLSAQDASTVKGGEKHKEIRLDSMKRYLERLKVLADINDPLIKKRFEDGEGM